MKKEFELKAFKLKGFGETECKYRLTVTEDDGEIYEQDYSIKLSTAIHSDLDHLFTDELHKVACMIFGEGFATDIIEPNPRIKVTGIAFAGKEENIGIALSGVLATRQGEVQWKTKRIKYKTGADEVCARLTVLAEALSKEIEAYLFESKVAEMTVFGDE